MDRSYPISNAGPSCNHHWVNNGAGALSEGAGSPAGLTRSNQFA